jgi:protein-tyrosine phosphatase
MTISVLFVCLGNVCRSPLAEGVFTQLVAASPLASWLTADSCGTAAFNIGKAPDSRAIDAARRAGFDISGQRARQITPADFDRFHYVLAMDRLNLMNLEALVPVSWEGEAALFKQYCQHAGNAQIADPYYEDANRFDALIPELERAARGLLAHIQASPAAQDQLAGRGGTAT